MNKHVRGVFKTGVDFSTHRRGIGYIVQEVVYNLWVKVGGAWVNARAWVKVSGVWRRAEPKVKVSGIWR